MAFSDFQDIDILQILVSFRCDHKSALMLACCQDTHVIELSCEFSLLDHEADKIELLEYILRWRKHEDSSDSIIRRNAALYVDASGKGSGGRSAVIFLVSKPCDHAFLNDAV